MKMASAKAARLALNALYGALNLEGAAKAAELHMGAWKGLDIESHYRRIREAIDALEDEGVEAD